MFKAGQCIKDVSVAKIMVYVGLTLGAASAPVIAVASISAFVAGGAIGGAIGSTAGKALGDVLYESAVDIVEEVQSW